MTTDNTPQCEQYNLEEDYPQELFFKDTNTTDLNFSNIGEYLDRKEHWLVAVYKDYYSMDKDPHYKKIWRKLGNANRELYRSAAIDCKVEKEICEVVFGKI